MRKFVCSLAFILLALQPATVVATQDNLILAGKVDQMFSQYNADTPGVAVAVVKNGKLILAKGYGMANLEYDVAITPQTVFHVASVSKQFTAFAVYLLASQRKLALTDNVRKYIPELPDYGTAITINHLLNHTSGLKDQWGLLTLAGWRMDDVITQQHVLNIIFAQQTLNFEPGSQFMYSNSGYTLLAEIVSRVSGQSFAEFTQSNIFQPLAMKNTQFYDDHEKVVKNRAYSYAGQDGAYQKQILSYATVGATGLFTTVEDLSKWALNFEQLLVGDAALLDAFNQPARLDNGDAAVLAVMDGETIYHAKGQFFRNYRGLTLYNHTGGDAGFRTYLARFPEQRMAFIVLSNIKSFQSLKSGLDVAGLYLADSLAAKHQQEPAAQNAKPAQSNWSVNNKIAEAYSGKYVSTELATAYSVAVVDEQLVLSHPRLADIPLTADGKDRFTGNIWFAVQLEFLRDQDNVITGFSLSNFGAKQVIFQKQN